MDPVENYPAQYESRLVLRNGSEILTRPLKPTDEGLIIAFFNKLSSRSIYMRFLRHLNSIPNDMLYRFTHIDYISNFALAAVVKGESREEIIAVARYIANHAEGHTELAIAVRDDWQNFGLGKALLKRLVEIGAEHGINRFSGLLDPRNGTIRQILTELGWKLDYTIKGGLYQVEIKVQE